MPQIVTAPARRALVGYGGPPSGRSWPRCQCAHSAWRCWLPTASAATSAVTAASAAGLAVPLW